MASLKKLKKAAVGIFWKEGETEPEDLAPQTQTLDPVTLPPSPTPVSSKVDQTFYKAIEAELTKSMPVEFAEFYNQMSVINDKFSNLDEPTRYQLAFHAAQTALKARNLTLSYQSLVKSAERMIEVLTLEKQEFDSQNEKGFHDNLAAIRRKVQEISEGIKSRESRILSLQKEMDAYIAAKTEEKRKLEGERDQLVSDRVVTESQINQLEQKKADRSASFNGALQAHNERLNELKSELENYLKGIK
ncbi:hypothetical protein JXO59_03415 [candidate division KSB1 bacterium]|nr:hypothetical protein [candidate division KSB1 bacterium]